MAKPKGSILVVDDEPAMRLLLSSVLKEEGHDVTAAASGEEALQLIAKRHYHLVLTDLKMPGISGLDLSGTGEARRSGHRGDHPDGVRNGRGRRGGHADGGGSLPAEAALQSRGAAPQCTACPGRAAGDGRGDHPPTGHRGRVPLRRDCRRGRQDAGRPGVGTLGGAHGRDGPYNGRDGNGKRADGAGHPSLESRGPSSPSSP